MFMEEERRPQQEEPVETEQAEEPQATLPLQPPPLPPSQETRSEMGEADHRVDEPVSYTHLTLPTNREV